MYTIAAPVVGAGVGEAEPVSRVGGATPSCVLTRLAGTELVPVALESSLRFAIRDPVMYDQVKSLRTDLHGQGG